MIKTTIIYTRQTTGYEIAFGKLFLVHDSTFTPENTTYINYNIDEKAAYLITFYYRYDYF